MGGGGFGRMRRMPQRRVVDQRDLMDPLRCRRRNIAGWVEEPLQTLVAALLPSSAAPGPLRIGPASRLCSELAAVQASRAWGGLTSDVLWGRG